MMIRRKRIILYCGNISVWLTIFKCYFNRSIFFFVFLLDISIHCSRKDGTVVSSLICHLLYLIQYWSKTDLVNWSMLLLKIIRFFLEAQLAIQPFLQVQKVVFRKNFQEQMGVKFEFVPKYRPLISNPSLLDPLDCLSHTTWLDKQK